MIFYRKRLAGLIAVLLLLGVVLVGCGEGEEEVEQAEEATPVEVVEAARGEVVNYATAVGQTEPSKTVRITPEVQGEVKDVEVEKGDQVKAGERLIQIDQEELENQVRQARSNYEQARSNYIRYQELYEKDVISKQQLENSEHQYISAESNYESARRRLRKAKIEAPISGIIDKVDVEEGEIAANQPVISLVKLDPIKLTAYISERHMPVLEPGYEVEIEFRSLAESYTSKIDKISPVADREQRKFAVEILLPNPEQEIKAGMYGKVEFKSAREVDQIVVPREAVLIRNGNQYIYLEEDGKAVYKEVTTGLSDGQQIAIKEGIQVGDRVIVTGNEQLADEEAVRLVEQGEI